MKSLLLMITFFTRIPIRYNYEYDEKDLIKGIKFFPIIGLIIGAAMCIPVFLKNVLHGPVIALLSWATYLWITGCLHIDGLADTFDGIFSNRNREKILEIMRDSRIGTFGVIGILFLLIWNLVFTSYIDIRLIIIVPVVGRSAAILSASISKYAREGQGMGKAFIENCGVKETIYAAIVSYIPVVLLLRLQGLVILSFTYLAIYILTKSINKKIGGMTGDTIGFIVELAQGIFIFFAYLLMTIIL
ncbi:adenosylcobinamide-GDP ribazoletransferase [Proteiniborus sp.]|uniref:adenosylcobinamide-GDP ribazoletransferase n=1 Tax=Proteiniborus sp. TaxID=2079015 RepID=UPI00332EA14A